MEVGLSWRKWSTGGCVLWVRGWLCFQPALFFLTRKDVTSLLQPQPPALSALPFQPMSHNKSSLECSVRSNMAVISNTSVAEDPPFPSSSSALCPSYSALSHWYLRERLCSFPPDQDNQPRLFLSPRTQGGCQKVWI